MTKTPSSTPTFESRLIPQSRELTDANGNVFFEHNSYLEPGEIVVDAHNGTELEVVKSQYRNPLTRQEFVMVAVREKDGSEKWIEMPASAVRRLNLA